jgi:hypothetical protein
MRPRSGYRDDDRMQPAWLLVHSPSVGPATWAPVAERLRARGYDCVVPSVRDVARAGPPFWPRVVEHANAALDRLDPHRTVLLALHSNAGLFAPMLIRRAIRPVHGCLFVDAALPVTAGSTPVAPPELLELLRGKTDADGLLPPWTHWWDEHDVAPMFPDARTRRTVTAEQPRLPLAYYEQSIPAPAGWDAVPCGYLFFGAPYDEVAAEAGERGWPVHRVPGLHLHQLVDPDGVTAAMVDLAGRLAGAARTASG